jgi:hypothetical protein
MIFKEPIRWEELGEQEAKDIIDVIENVVPTPFWIPLSLFDPENTTLVAVEFRKAMAKEAKKRKALRRAKRRLRSRIRFG